MRYALDKAIMAIYLEDMSKNGIFQTNGAITVCACCCACATELLCFPRRYEPVS